MIDRKDRISARRSLKVDSPQKAADHDPFKWIALIITLVGVFAWAAGAAFNQGYWTPTGWQGAIGGKTLQDVAFDGFTGPITNWFVACGVIVVIGCYVLFLEFLSTLPVPRKNNQRMQFLKNIKWLAERREIDADMKKFSGYSIVGAVLGILLAFLFVLWIYSAAASGRNQIINEVCEARSAAVLPSVVELDGGIQLSGKILDQTEKALVLLSKNSVYILSVGDKSKRVATVDMASLQCPSQKK